MIKHIKNIKEYNALSFEEKLISYLDEEAAHSVHSEESGDILVDISHLDGSGILIHHDTVPNALVRKGFGEKIIQAAQILRKKGYGLEIHELYRDIEKQRRDFAHVSAMVKEQHPFLTGKALWEKTTQFIADPDMTPPHCTGGACDVRLISLSTLDVVDMGSELNTPDDRSHFLHKEVSEEQLQNRKTLRDAFLKVECAPLPTEWWHFSYGEKYWAALYQTTAVYGVIAP